MEITARITIYGMRRSTILKSRQSMVTNWYSTSETTLWFLNHSFFFGIPIRHKCGKNHFDSFFSSFDILYLNCECNIAIEFSDRISLHNHRVKERNKEMRTWNLLSNETFLFVSSRSFSFIAQPFLPLLIFAFYSLLLLMFMLVLVLEVVIFFLFSSSLLSFHQMRRNAFFLERTNNNF